MPQVPVSERETRLNGAPLPYQHLYMDGNTFGAAQYHGLANVGQGLKGLANIALEIQNTRDEAKLVEATNQLDKWQQDNLYDKDNGYYYKTGKDASGQTENVMKSFDDFVTEYKSQNKMSKQNQMRLDDIINKKRNRIFNDVNAHDYKQTGIWAQTEGQKGIENAIQGMVQSRNNPEERNIYIANGLSVIDWQGQVAHLDSETVDAMKKDFLTKGHEATLNTLIQEGDLSAKEYFEANKNDISSAKHAHYIGAIKNEEDKYAARGLANDIIANSATEEEAIRKAESIKDINMSDSVVSRVKRHYSQEEHFKNQAEREALDGFYQKAVFAAQNGGTISYDDIPDSIDPQMKLSLMNYVNSNGQPETDNQNWEILHEMSVNDAQGFANVDLNKYRGWLSESDYRQFLKRQEDIKAGKFYTTIKDDDKMINAALKEMGLSGNTSLFGLTGKNKDIAYSEIRAMVRELEARKGRKITDAELQSITNSLGYKENGIELYKQLEKGMREKVGFTRDVMNDFAYYQSKHNGEMPSDAEKLKIINNRLNMKVQEKKTQAQQMVDRFSSNAMTMRNIAYTVPKPNEQKVLTFFADNQIPTVGKQLGLRLMVTSRYRNQAGSHHAEGRAADVSMSEHSVQNRIKIYERLLSLPTVQAIGTSDPNILAHFNGNPKLKDERKYDRQHGTNHVNHAHVTLINYNPQTPAANKVANNGTYRF